MLSQAKRTRVLRKAVNRELKACFDETLYWLRDGLDSETYTKVLEIIASEGRRKGLDLTPPT